MVCVSPTELFRFLATISVVFGLIFDSRVRKYGSTGKNDFCRYFHCARG